MKEILHKPKYTGLGYDKLSKLINDKYVDNPDLWVIVKELGISASLVFEATGWKDHYEFIVDEV